MYFSINIWILFWLAAIGALFFLLNKKMEFLHPALFFPDTASLQKFGKTAKASLIHSPGYLIKISLSFFILAALDPQIRKLHEIDENQYRQLPKEGEAIYFVIDRSSSMKNRLNVIDIKKVDSFPSILEVSKRLTGDFIKHRKQDLIGLVAFARTAQILSPLTLNHQSVLKKLEALNAISNDDLNGSAIGYAIFKTASIMAATKHFTKGIQTNRNSSYQIDGMAMIVLSDGLQEIHPEDIKKRLRSIEIEEASQYAKTQGIRIYLVSIAAQINQKEFEAYRNMLHRSAEITGGKFYSAGNAEDLKVILDEINRTEKIAAPLMAEDPKFPSLSSRVYSIYPLCILLGMASLFLSIFLQTTLIRRIP